MYRFGNGNSKPDFVYMQQKILYFNAATAQKKLTIYKVIVISEVFQFSFEAIP